MNVFRKLVLFLDRVLQGKDIQIKKEYVVFVVMLKPLITDIKCFAEYKFDLRHF
jgi:hypothetical protein